MQAFFYLILWALTISGSALAQSPKVAPLLSQQMARQGKADFFIVLKDAHTPKILEAARALPDRKARQAFMVDRLQKESFASQSGLGLYLLRQGADYQHFWIVNQILVQNGAPELLAEIQKREEVLRLDPNPTVKVPLPAPQPQTGPSAEQMATGLEWNIAKIKADQVWSTYGATGAGVVVAVHDTGVYWEHEALRNQYRGWNGGNVSHTYNWHDAIHTSSGNPCGNDSPFPCDDHGHGTHVGGTMVGRTDANQIGVAPGAQWIACRNMDGGNGTPATYLECLQWFLAPDGNPDMAPHIINNSWSCPPREGCSQDTLEQAVVIVRAADILMAGSNGNSGSGCSTTHDPPAIYREVFTAGATDSGDNLASFSSRGPVTYGGETYIKPNISAPGVSIRSSLANGSYGYMSGTSMASPHVAGAAALLWSAFPHLVDNLNYTEEILKLTALPRDYTACGDPPGAPNNGYGYGRVDILSAFREAQQPTFMPIPKSLGPTGVSSTGFTANWLAVPQAAGYRLDVSPERTFQSFIHGYQDRAVTGASFAVTGLNPKTTYFYRLRAEDNLGTSGNSDVISVLTLMGFTPAPFLDLLLSP